MCLRARSPAQKGLVRAFQTLSQPFPCPARPQGKSFPSRGSREKALSKDFLEGPLPCCGGGRGGAPPENSFLYLPVLAPEFTEFCRRSSLHTTPFRQEVAVSSMSIGLPSRTSLTDVGERRFKSLLINGACILAIYSLAVHTSCATMSQSYNGSLQRASASRRRGDGPFQALCHPGPA